MPAYLFCRHYTQAAVRTVASLRRHWCMGGSFMLLGAWSIDSLTSALYEATDDSETRARVHDCYRICKGVTCRTSLSYVKGVGKRQVALERPCWTMTDSESGCVRVGGTFHGFLLHKACGRGLHNRHHLYTSFRFSRKGFYPHTRMHTHTHTWATPIKSFTSLCGTPLLLLWMKPKPPPNGGLF